MKEKILWGIAVVGLVLGVSPLFTGVSLDKAILGAAGNMLVENYDPYNRYNDGYKSENEIVLSGADGDITTGDDLTVTDRLAVTGQTATEGFTQGGAVTVLTDVNGGTYTLTQAEMLATGMFEFAAGGAGQEVIQLTFPATSTMTTLIPNAGDCRTWVYDASALAAATTTTLTKGTGHNIIAYTADDDLIDGAEFSQIRMCRKTNTDGSGTLVIQALKGTEYHGIGLGRIRNIGSLSVEDVEKSNILLSQRVSTVLTGFFNASIARRNSLETRDESVGGSRSTKTKNTLVTG